MNAENIALARRAIRLFPMTDLASRASVMANRRNWIAARQSMRATLLDDAEYTRSPRVLGSGSAPLSALIVNTYDRHKDTMVLVVTVAAALPLLALDILAMAGA